jgi:hypothetical protein
VLAASLTAAAQTTRSYTVLGQHSTLRETGGFAGVNNLYRVIGGFELTTAGSGWIGSGTASFPTAELWGSQVTDGPSIAANPSPSNVLDVDDLLNFTELYGEGLPVAGPYDAYRFTGYLGNSDATSPLEHGPTVEFLGIVVGPYFYLRGGTLPQGGSADFFDYSLRMIARTGGSADANGDGVVNAADYTVIRDSLPNSSLVANLASDDPLALWQTQYGESMPSLAALDSMLLSAASGATAIPEPGALALILVASVGSIARRRLE